jgi:hypothetical protein
MKKLFLSLVLVIVAVSMVNAQAIPKSPIITFVWLVNDFGVIPKGKPVTCKFEFKVDENGQPGIIKNVKSNCGCIKAEWPKEPIAPGRKGFLYVTYDAAFSRPFNKTVNVYFDNLKNPILLTIAGAVID